MSGVIRHVVNECLRLISEQGLKEQELEEFISCLSLFLPATGGLFAYFLIRKELNKLELVELRGITSKTAKILAYKPIDQLKTLILHDLPNWPLGASSLICTSCGNLKKIDFKTIHMSNQNLSKIIDTNKNLQTIILNNILEQRPFITGSCVSTLLLNNPNITHFITNDDVLRQSIEKSSENVVTNFIGSTGNSKKKSVQIPLSPLPSKTWNLVSGEQDVLNKMKNDDIAALEEALAEKVTVSDQVIVKRDLRLLKNNLKKKKKKSL